MAVLISLSSSPADIPGTDFRLATISGPPPNCARAKEMVEAIVAEVITVKRCIINYLYMCSIVAREEAALLCGTRLLVLMDISCLLSFSVNKPVE